MFDEITAVRKGPRRTAKLKTMLHVAALVQRGSLHFGMVQAVNRGGNGAAVGVLERTGEVRRQVTDGRDVDDLFDPPADE